MQKMIVKFSLLVLGAVGIGFSGWASPGTGTIDYVTITPNVSGCSAPPAGQAWVSFGFKGDNYNYLMLMNDTPISKGILSMLYAAKTSKAKVMVENGTSDCGGNKTFSGLQLAP